MLLLVLRVVLAVVFGAAAVAKLRDTGGTRRAVGEFGVPDRVVGIVSVLLPIVELAIALLLLPDQTASMAAAGALLLLAVFVAAIGVNLARGRRPECNCFGQLHSAPVGWRTIARNLLLAVLAVLVLAGPADAAVGVAVAAAFGLAAAASLALDRLWRNDATADGALTIGSPAPGFKLSSLEGATVTLDSLLSRGRPLLLLFSDPHCGPCTALAPDLARWQRRHSDEVTIAVLERGRGEMDDADEHGRRDVLVQRENEVADAYGARGTPGAVLVDIDGRIASGPVGGRLGIEALLAEHVVGFESSQRDPRAKPPAELRRREALARFGVATGVMASLGLPAQATAEGFLARRRCRRNRDCRGTLQCIEGECKCPALYLDQCGHDCVDLNGDPSNCGDCGVQCAAGESCVGGKCREGDSLTCNPPCPVGQACCLEGNGPRCVDLSTGAGEHCGQCGHNCTPTEVCCDGRCKNLFQSPNRCTNKQEGCFGIDKKKCKKGQVCFNGRCRYTCPRLYTRCGDFCLDRTRKEQCCDAKVYAQSDLHNCGACGHDCTKFSGFRQAACCPNVGCVDLAVNPENCGACGNRCPSNCQCVPGPGGKGICTNCV